MGKSVFISHAVKDRDLAQALVTLIEEGIGVPEKEIFCSSLPGYGIPTGDQFVGYIKEQLQGPKVVVLLLTPAYFESKFCLSELGAAWAMSHAIYPILVPPLQYADVKDVLLGTQVTKIEDEIGYNQLRDHLQKTVSCNEASSTKWDTKRRAFLKALETLLAKVAPASHVSADAHAALQGQLDEARAELDANEEDLQRLKAQLQATEQLKDRTEVAAVQAEFAPEAALDLQTEFDRLVKAVIQAKSKFATAVAMLALSERYDLPYTIDWHEDRPTFEAAARRKYVDATEGRVLWSAPAMIALATALDELEAFTRFHRRELETALGDVPLDPTAQDFWEEHYGLYG